MGGLILARSGQSASLLWEAKVKQPLSRWPHIGPVGVFHNSQWLRRLLPSPQMSSQTELGAQAELAKSAAPTTKAS